MKPKHHLPKAHYSGIIVTVLSIDPVRRAETLGSQGFTALADAC